MRTPPLRRRVVWVGVLVIAAVLTFTGAFLCVMFRAALLDQLSEVLDQRAELVVQEAGARTPEQLAIRLTQLGLQAVVRSADGTVYRADPPSPTLGAGLPAEGGGDGFIARQIQLPDGSTVTVFARRTGVDHAVSRLIGLQVAGLALSAVFGALLLLRTSHFVLKPLRQMTAAARRTSAGQWGERLRPDRPDTSLGALAVAYDEMLASVESTLHEANQAKAESEAHYLQLRQTIETADAAFVSMDDAGTIVDWNSKAEEVFGWTRSEAVGRDLGEMIVPEGLRAAHQAGVRRFALAGDHTMLGRRVELEACRKDGRVVPVEVSTWVTHDGDKVRFNAFLHDITERREGQEAIARLAAIVESAQEAIYSTALDGTILTWNPGAHAMYQLSPDEAIGRQVSVIVPPECFEDEVQARARIARGERVPMRETVRRRKDGSHLNVAVTDSPVFDGDGRVVAASTVARDTTEQCRVRAQLDATHVALEVALDEARRAEERSRRFSADAAHQIRSPIAGVRACAETLLMGAEGEDAERLLVGLVRETSRAGRLVNSLLRLAEMDQAHELNPEPCDIVSLCTSEIHLVRALAPTLHVALHVRDLPEFKPVLDEHSVREMLGNLLDNARRHARTTIDLLVWATEAELRIRVADDGPGVPEDQRPRVFERFVSLDGKGGSGLGLPIARSLARSNAGDLVYDGEAFVISLPLVS